MNTDHSIALRSLWEFFETSTQFQDQFLFVDACRNVPPWGEGAEFTLGSRSRARATRASRPCSSSSATSPKLKAVEVRETAGEEHGALTAALLAGLRGAGAAKAWSWERNCYEVRWERLADCLRRGSRTRSRKARRHAGRRAAPDPAGHWQPRRGRAAPRRRRDRAPPPTCSRRNASRCSIRTRPTPPRMSACSTRLATSWPARSAGRAAPSSSTCRRRRTRCAPQSRSSGRAGWRPPSSCTRRWRSCLRSRCSRSRSRRPQRPPRPLQLPRPSPPPPRPPAPAEAPASTRGAELGIRRGSRCSRPAQPRRGGGRDRPRVRGRACRRRARAATRLLPHPSRRAGADDRLRARSALCRVGRDRSAAPAGGHGALTRNCVVLAKAMGAADASGRRTRSS